MQAFAGIDVAKASLAVALYPGGQRLDVGNDARGHATLCRWLRHHEVSRVLLEATGGYEQAVAVMLSSQWPVVRIPPHRARAFAVAMGKIAKTDPIDAAMLAHLAAVVKGPVLAPPCPAEVRLQALVRRREQLVEQRDAERRRLLQAHDALVRRSLQRQLKQLAQEIARLDQEVASCVPLCGSERAERLRRVPGIGAVTVATLMAFLPELGQLESRQVSALAGLAPYNCDSGKHQGVRRIRGGRANVRRILYMAAWSAVRHQPDFKLRYAALRARGKCAKVALVACMRVLLIRLNAMLRDGSEWKTLAA